ncbi:hypothetical protein RCL1_000676 [Eukaryota sp. TZLM3-RCL]
MWLDIDDLTLLGQPEHLNEVLPVFAALAFEVGLKLKKCVFVYQQEKNPLILDEHEIPSLVFENDALRLLGSFIGNSSKVKIFQSTQGNSFRRLRRASRQ